MARMKVWSGEPMVKTPATPSMPMVKAASFSSWKLCLRIVWKYVFMNDGLARFSAICINVSRCSLRNQLSWASCRFFSLLIHGDSQRGNHSRGVRRLVSGPAGDICTSSCHALCCRSLPWAGSAHIKRHMILDVKFSMVLE
ncbi:hypothetical protein MPH_01751 [Macrophomina phaseolina MS6]|uniref:Uncharacterized protein n=1 Tax=Macrophomina phaseolina (strain MS6) TaxID=1126212 RepID=K2S7K1_MACPH|nr:hypothetical protein MPH_01751 [Macrophomina phaseolina MS6]